MARWLLGELAMIRTTVGAALSLALMTGCLADGVRCADGSLCPLGDVCLTVPTATAEVALCGQAWQGEACDARDDGTACGPPGATPVGTCLAGVCVVLTSDEPRCGDGVVQPGEACDCSDGSLLVLPPGCPAANSDDPADPTAVCRVGCELEQCGDGVVSAWEECEGDASTLTCADVGFHPGATPTATLACDPHRCRAITDACAGRCGDGIVDAPEACDGAPATACVALGFDAGRAACSASCGDDVTTCRTIGPRWDYSVGEAIRRLAVGPDTRFTLTGSTVYATDPTAAQPVPVPILRTTVLVAPGTTPPTLRAMAVDAAGALYVVGSQGTLLRWDGARWGSVFGGAAAPGMFDVAAAGTEIVAVGDDATIRAWRDDQWMLEDATGLGAGRQLRAVAITAPGAWTLASKTALWERGPAGWAAVRAGTDFVAVVAAGPSLLAVESDGTIHRRVGATWTSSVLPLAPGLTAVRAAGLPDGHIAVLDSAAGLHWHDGRGWTQLVMRGLTPPDGGSVLGDLLVDGDALRFTADVGAWSLTEAWAQMTYAAPSGARVRVGAVDADDHLWALTPTGLLRDGVAIAGSPTGGTCLHLTPTHAWICAGPTLWGYELATATWSSTAWPAQVLDVDGDPATTQWIVGGDGLFARRQGLVIDLGVAPTTAAITAVRALANGDLVFGGSGFLAHLPAGTPLADATVVDLPDDRCNALWSDGVAAAAAMEGGGFYRFDAGWDPVPEATSPGTPLTAIAAQGTRVVTASSAGLLQARDAQGWTPILPSAADSFTSVWFDGSRLSTGGVTGATTLMRIAAP